MRRIILVLAAGAVCACGVGSAPLTPPGTSGSSGAGNPNGCSLRICTPEHSDGGASPRDAGTSDTGGSPELADAGDAVPDAGPFAVQDAGSTAAADAGAFAVQDAGSSATGDAGTQKPVIQACTATWLLDGGDYPADAVAQARARADGLPTADPGEASDGCEVRAFGDDGALQLDDRYDDQWRLLSHVTVLADGGTGKWVRHVFDGGLELERFEGEGEGPITIHRWSYDDAGNLVSETSQTGDGPITRIEWTYDSGHHPLQMTTQTGDGGVSIATWSYDAEGRLVRYQAGTDEIDFEYPAADESVKRTFQDGRLLARELYRYDEAGRVRSISSFPDEVRTFPALFKSWEYDDAGTLRRDDFIDNNWGEHELDEYDAEGRVTALQRDYTELGADVSYVYDDEGNGFSGRWSIDSRDQHQGVGRWWFGLAPRVDLLAVHDFEHDWSRGVEGWSSTVTLRMTDADGRLLRIEDDVDGNCRPDGSFEALRDARGILREEHLAGTRGGGVRTFTGKACPEFPQGSPYWGSGFGPYVHWVDMTPRR